MTQIIYPKYAGFIVIYGLSFLFLGASIARALDILFPKFPDTKEKVEGKKKIQYILEIVGQIALVILGTYLFREVTDFIFKSIKPLKVHMYGNPDRFAAIIIAPVMFAVQPNLVLKIMHVWGL